MSLPTPNYVTTEDLHFPNSKVKFLPSGSFVRPIDIKYLPVHCLDHRLTGYVFFPNYQVMAYCSAGIVPIDKKSIRKAD